MRWSLILSTSVFVLSTLSVALVIPSESSSVDLERRAGGAKTSNYRKNAENHDYLYSFDKTGAVSRQKLNLKDRPANGRKILKLPKTDADHVFEDQMFNNHLAKHNLKYQNLDPKLQDKVKGILNGPKNMAPVPARVNRRKGQVIKHGMRGKPLKRPNKSSDQYTLLSYGTAKKTAKQLDEAFKEHGHDFGDRTFHKTLRNTINNAKIMNPGDPSPETSSGSDSKGSESSDNESSKASKASSNHGSVKASPRKSFVVGSRARPKMLPIRTSARIAAINKAKGKTGDESDASA